MKVLFLLPGRGWKPVGGVKVVYEYANCLVRRGHEVTVVHPALLQSDTPLSQRPKKLLRYLQAQVDRSYLPSAWFHLDSRVRMLWTWSLHPKYLPEADAVVATAWQTAEWVVNYPASKGEKFYLIQHWENWDGVSEDRLRRTWTAPLKKIVISRWLQNIALDLEQNAEYLPNGLDFDTFGLDRSIEERDPLSLLMLYHEQPWKGSRDGLEAVEIVRSLYPDLRLRLFGTHPRAKQLPDWIEYHRLPTQPALRKLYNESAVFLSPSWSEGWGLPAAEAMQCGAAVVATDIGGHREFLQNGVNGLLTPSKNPAALAEAIIKLLAHPELRIRYATAGHRSIQRFTWKMACDGMERILQKNLSL